MRRPGSLVYFSIFVLLIGCSSRPGWIKRLPAHSSEKLAEFSTAAGEYSISGESATHNLDGYYEREFASYYSVSKLGNSSLGLECLCIRGKQFTKLHMIVETKDERQSAQLYQEEGQLKIQFLAHPQVQVMVLLEPVQARQQTANIVLQAEGLARLKASQRAACASGQPGKDFFLKHQPGISLSVAAPVESASHGGPLLHYWIQDRYTALLPLAFERQGKVYDFGAHEGAIREYDFNSPAMQRALLKYRTHEFQSHAYFRPRQ